MLDYLDSEKIMKNWYLDVLIYSKEPKWEYYDFIEK